MADWFTSQSQQYKYLLGAAIASWTYVSLCNLLRFRRARKIASGWVPAQNGKPLSEMTAVEAYEIQTQLSELEFPSLYEKGLQMALFRTYGIPSVSKLLVGTKQLSTSENVGKRYADTGVLISELYGSPPTDQRVFEAYARLNYLHGHYITAGKISNDDMLYTLSLFSAEPAHWVDRFEWRKFTDVEKCAMGVVHKLMGEAMQISFDNLPSAKEGWRDGLHFYDELDEWGRQYGDKNLVPHQNNRTTADETLRLLLSTMPNFIHGFLANVVKAALDDQLRTSIIWDRPSQAYINGFNIFMSIRRFYLRCLSLPRFDFQRDRFIDDKLINGRYGFARYDTMPYYVRPTLMNRWGPGALIARLNGHPLPGDEGYYPEGYKTLEAGPKFFEAKGDKEMKETMGRVRSERTSEAGLCPFAMRKR